MRSLLITFTMLGTAGLFLWSGVLQAELPTLHDKPHVEGQDRPSGSLIIRIPSLEVNGNGTNAPSSEGSTPPAEPSGPSTEAGDPPSFFGEPVSGDVVWILDCSESMDEVDSNDALEDWNGDVLASPNRLDIVKTETINALNGLADGTRFDFVLLAGASNDKPGKVTQPVTDAWQNQLIECSDETRKQAIDYVSKLTMWWGTPTYEALKRATNDYGTELGTLFFLSDGRPYPENIAGGSHNAKIFSEFPGWFTPLRENGCDLVCIHIGDNPNAGSFMQDFAAQNGAEYIHR